jgi:hypothetical protein
MKCDAEGRNPGSGCAPADRRKHAGTTEITVADRLTKRLLANQSQNGVSADSSP